MPARRASFKALAAAPVRQDRFASECELLFIAWMAIGGNNRSDSMNVSRNLSLFHFLEI
jgi:hypothetical protein